MTLETILQRIGAYVDQSDTTPTSTDLTVRTKYVNQGYEQWAMTFDWGVLRIEAGTTISVASTVSIGLPTNFKKLASPLYDYGTGDKVIPDEYPEISPEERYNKLDTDKYCYLIGNAVEGQALIVPKGLASGASIKYMMYSFPSSLATLQDIPVLANPNFLVEYGIAKVLEARGDSRFPQAQATADRTLQNMLENEYSRGGGRENRVPNYYERISNRYRIGRS